MPEHVSGNPQNERPVKERRGRSTFDLSHYIFGTHRFAQYNLNFIQDCVGGDKIPVRSSDVIDSYTLKAPLMQDVQKTKEYFYVNKQAILPNNWDKLERLPALGDDVNAVNVNSTITDFMSNNSDTRNFFISLFNFPNTPEDVPDKAEALLLAENYMRRMLFGELWFSQGSLLSACGVHLSELFFFNVDGVNVNFDTYFDTVVSYLINTAHIETVTFGTRTFDLLDIDSVNYISVHRFLEMARDDYNFHFGSSKSESTVVDAVKAMFYAKTDDYPYKNYLDWEIHRYADNNADDINFSIDRCAAYQLVCAHYFSNDSIDFVHSADLWRQNMYALAWNLLTSIYSVEDMEFSYNGVNTMYDTLSYFYIKSMFHFYTSLSDIVTLFDSVSSANVQELSFFGYFINLLGWRRSLRYQDYFTGAKARPLAVGDFSVAVNNSAVDVVDITKKISLQRLANNVNRIGNSIDKWYKEIMGSDLNYDYHNPMWLASTRSTVYASKSENTAEAQQSKPVSTVANFVGKDSNFEFTMRPDRNGIIIGITYYDIRRAYFTGIDRMAQHVDRFDGFIPDMQFIGDQPVYGNELTLIKTGHDPISYQLRNAEYKQRNDMCYGGFVDKLPGFAFLFRPEYLKSGGDTSPLATISPEFIRSRCDEFDQFYISLGGYSNGHYFHFIVKTYNEVKASRPMIFAPQIL